ncbi:MAG: RNA-binding protein [Eubacterium sp.]|nr:RNA-binding protein [Eubacterium sp.]
MNEKDLLEKRITELYNRAFERGYNTFSEFLNLDELSTALNLKLPCSVFGGYENAERCVIGFGNDIINEDFPICCIKIEPLKQKFADKLTHRDFLGSLMNLGINRSTLGDIIINENSGYLFCLESISDYIIENLSRVKHTSVKCKKVSSLTDMIINEPETKEIIVSSIRADAIISAVYKLSRNEVSSLFNQQRVFINSKTVTKPSVFLKENDIVSVRHKGRFIFCFELRQTKKERIVVEVKIYR